LWHFQVFVFCLWPVKAERISFVGLIDFALHKAIDVKKKSWGTQKSN